MSNDRAILLTEESMSGGESGAGKMRKRCAFTSRDMGADWPEAFTYAIVLGWGPDPDDPDDEHGALPELAARYDWDDDLVVFLRDTHDRFNALPDHAAPPKEQPHDSSPQKDHTRNRAQHHQGRPVNAALLRVVAFMLIGLGAVTATAGWFWLGVQAWQERNAPGVDEATFTIWAFLTIVVMIGCGAALLRASNNRNPQG